MACPVGKLMQKGGVMPRRALEALYRRQVYPILRGAIKGPTASMYHLQAHILRQLRHAIIGVSLDLRTWGPVQRGDTIDL